MFCSKCNTENEQRALFCIECGESLAEPEPEPEPEPEESVSIVICDSCENENEPGAQFCVKCGKSLVQIESEELPSTVSCYKCKKQNEADTVFCVYCGEKLKTPKLQDSDTTAPVEATMTKPFTESRDDGFYLSNTAVSEQQKEFDWIDFDRVLGLNWLAIIGGFSIVVAFVVFGYQFYEEINPWIRLAVGLLLGAAFVVVGDSTKKRYGLWSHVTTGVGLSIFYAAVWASFTAWALYPAWIGLVGLGVIGVVGWYLAIRLDGMWVAILSVSGIFISPFVVGSSSTEIDPLLTVGYVIFMDLLVLGISTQKNWRLLNQLSLFGSYIYLWHAGANLGLDIGIQIVGLIIVYLIFVGVTSLFHVIKDNEPEFPDLSLTMSNTALFYLNCIVILGADYPVVLASITLGLAVLNCLMALYIYLTDRPSKSYALIFFVKAAVFLSAAIPIYMSGVSTTIIWVLMGAGITFIGLETNQWKWRVYSSCLFTLGIFKLLLFDFHPEISDSVNAGYSSFNWSDIKLNGFYPVVIENSPVIVTVVSTLSLWLGYLMYKRKKWVLGAGMELTGLSNNSEPDNDLTAKIDTFAGEVNILFLKYEFWRPLILLVSGTLIFWLYALVYVDLPPIMLSLSLVVFSLGVIVVGIRLRNIRTRLAGFGFLAVSMLKIFLYDTFNSGQVFGFIGLLSLGILLLGTSFIYQRNKDKLQTWIKE